VDKFSFVCSNFDVDSAKKMGNRLEFFYGKDIVVYCNGRESKDWANSVNAAFILKSKFPNCKVRFVVKHVISGYKDLDQCLMSMMRQKNIEIISNLELKSIKDQKNLVFQKCDYSETTLSRVNTKNHQNGQDFPENYDLNEIAEYNSSLDVIYFLEN
jgi:hypothetical protein